MNLHIDETDTRDKLIENDYSFLSFCNFCKFSYMYIVDLNL